MFVPLNELSATGHEFCLWERSATVCLTALSSQKKPPYTYSSFHEIAYCVMYVAVLCNELMYMAVRCTADLRFIALYKVFSVLKCTTPGYCKNQMNRFILSTAFLLWHVFCLMQEREEKIRTGNGREKSTNCSVRFKVLSHLTFRLCEMGGARGLWRKEYSQG